MFVFCGSLIWLSCCFSIACSVDIITVDGDDGHDSPSCLYERQKPCKSLEYIAKNMPSVDYFTIEIVSSHLLLQEMVLFANMPHLTIRGNGSNVTTVQCNISTWSGIKFIRSNDTYLEGFTLTKCGGYLDEYNVSVAMTMLKCVNVSIKDVVFHSNNGYGLIIVNTTGKVNIKRSHFISNYFRSQPDGHSMHGRNIHFSGGGLRIYFTYVQNLTSYNISSCFFHLNLNNYKKQTYSLKKFGGGAHIYIFSHTKYVTISFDDCHFKSNSAVAGGGIYVEIGNGSMNNSVKFYKCNFTNNTALKYGGGGADVGFGQHTSTASSNNITFFKCNFSNNSANFGGGVDVFSATILYNYKQPTKNRVKFLSCSFKHNKGDGGAAIHIENRQNHYGYFLTIVIFCNNKFIDNSIVSYSNSTDKNELIQSGVILTIDIDLVFICEDNLFLDNKGTALYCASAEMVFNNCSVNFTNNVGTYGGGILLVNNGHLYVDHGSKIIFERNSAIYGGGLCVIFNDLQFLYYSKTCFLKTTAEPKIKKFEFIFNGNNASGIGDDMFVSTFYPCLKFKENNSATSLFKQDESFKKFNFTSTSVSRIGTATCKFKLNTYSIRPFPGISYNLSLIQLDEFQNDVSHLFTISARIIRPPNSSVVIDKSYVTIIDRITFHGNPNDTATLVLQSKISNIRLKVNVTLSPCPPGNYFDKVLGTCICSHGYYYGINYCLENHSAVTVEGIWAGYSENGQFITADCPIQLCSYSHTNTLPINSSLLNDMICSMNRYDIMCSRCKPGYATSFHSPTFKCIDSYTSQCKYGFLLYIASEIVPVTIIFLLILIFNINLISGSLYTFIFYSQVLNNFYIDAYHLIQYKNVLGTLSTILKIIYGLFDFNFFNEEVFSFCLFRDATALGVVSFKCITLIYAILLIIITIIFIKLNSLYTCIRLCNKFGRRDVRGSIIHGLTAFLILCYSNVLYTSFRILARSNIYGDNSTFLRAVPLYQGSYTYMGHEHLRYAIPASIFILVMIVPPPIILLFEPAVLRLSGMVTVNENECFYRLRQFRLRLKPFLDSFQGCFKDNCRCFAGLFFLYRIVINLPTFVSPNMAWNYCFAQIVLLLILLLHAVCRPFQTNWHNYIDILLLIDMSLVNLLTLTQYSISVVRKVFVGFNTFTVIATAQIVLITLPLICLVTYVIIHLYIKFKPAKRQVNEDSDDDELPARLRELSYDDY
jgi:hypothetical protein